VVWVTFAAALLAIAGTVMVLSTAFVGIGVFIRRGFGLRRRQAGEIKVIHVGSLG